MDAGRYRRCVLCFVKNKFVKNNIVENLSVPRIYLFVLGLCRVYEVSRAARDESGFCSLCINVIK
jgi:hypothetical protein